MPEADGAAVEADPVRDLDTPDEIAEMVRRFYADVAQDDRLGPIFNDVANVDWHEHLPKLTAFWCRALLGLRGYDGNPLREHTRVNGMQPFEPADFARWLALFTETIELGWAGPKADRALHLAHNVARVHQRQLAAPEPTADTGKPDPGEAETGGESERTTVVISPRTRA